MGKNTNMNKEEIVHKIKCKNCQTILSDEIKGFQKCKCSKVKFDTDNAEFYVRIVGNEENYEIIK